MRVTSLGRAILSYKIHWHAILIHFPVSFFLSAFIFQILHLFSNPIAFELATNVELFGGTLFMYPTVISGWFSWKKNYKGAWITLFQTKIVTSFIMLGLSTILSVWRFIFLSFFEEAPESPSHWIYLAGNTLLIFGAIVEGYYGGRLHHR